MMQLESQYWHQQQLYLKYYFTPPLIFSWNYEGVFIRIKIRDLRTRASRCYRLGNVDGLSERRLPDIGLTVLLTESLENGFGNPVDPTTHSGACAAALEETVRSTKDSASVSKNSAAHLDEPVSA